MGLQRVGHNLVTKNNNKTELMYAHMLSHFSHVRFFATPWTVAHQAPLFMGISRQEYWSGLLCPSPGDLPDPGINTASPALAGIFFTTEPPGKPLSYMRAKSLQSCPTLCDPIDCSTPGSSLHGILQARIPEWIAISFSRESCRPRN